MNGITKQGTRQAWTMTGIGGTLHIVRRIDLQGDEQYHASPKFMAMNIDKWLSDGSLRRDLLTMYRAVGGQMDPDDGSISAYYLGTYVAPRLLVAFERNQLVLLRSVQTLAIAS